MLKYLTLHGWLTSAVVLTHTWCLRVLHSISLCWASLVAQLVKNPLAMQEIPVQFLDQEDPLEKGMTTLSSVLTWRIPWTEEPGRLQSMGLQRVRHDWATFTFSSKYRAFLLAQLVKNLPAIQKTWVQILDWEDPLEEGIATHSSILAWRIPWTEEPGRLQSMGL